MKFQVTKHYPHSLGLSACFRQWRSHSHCSYLHGYPLAFTFVFEAEELDTNNWVIDFGDLGNLKSKLQDTFDHKLVVAKDDPHLDDITLLSQLGVADVLVMHSVGCERFAELACELAERMLFEMGVDGRVRVVSATCHEHEGNSATFVPGA